MLIANFGVGRDGHVVFGQHERALLAVEREHGHACTHGQHQGGLGPYTQ